MRKKSVGEDVKEMEGPDTVGGFINWCSYYGKQYGDSSKMESRIAIWSSNSTFEYLSEENKKIIIQKIHIPLC